MDLLRRATRPATGDRRRVDTRRAGRSLRRLIAVAMVPLFGVAVTLVPVSSSASAAPAVPAAAAARAVSAAPAAASSNFWTYETIKRESQISQDNNYDFSAKMTHEMEKITRKALADRVTKVGRWLSLLAAAINAFVHNHSHAAAIVGFIAAVIAVLNIKKVASLWKWLKGIIYKGKHRRSGVDRSGFWATIFS